MNDLKHTPGPWTAYELPHTKNEYHQYWHIDGGCGYCCYKKGFSIAGCISEPDAKLIAASPELLDACIKSLEVFKQLADAGRYPEPLMAENGGEGLMFLTKAIEKATK
jgi:hypothetical protein